MGDISKTRGNTARKKGKMYWKFATLEGWQAKKEPSPNSGLTEDVNTDETAKKEVDHSSDEPDQSAR